MPPSGYSFEQAEFVRRFLNSCAAALEAEAVQFGATYLQRLEFEVADIARYVSSQKALTQSQLAVLSLTADFYEKVIGHQPSNSYSFWAAVEIVLGDIGSSVLEIKIEPAFA